jgi:ProP effector
LRERNGAGAGDLTIAGPLSSSVIYGDTNDIAQSPSTPQSEILSARRARIEAAKAAIAAPAELLPAVFVAEKWEPHKPLKIRIRANLIATGLLTPSECSHGLRAYTGRLQYQKALAGGGRRYDLDGNPAGEVTRDQAELAAAAVARVEAKASAKTEAARRQKTANRAARERTADQQLACRTPPTASSSAAPRRDGLADLKRAAAARRGAPS